MKKILNIALKELKLIKSQRVSLALVLAYPFLVVISIGLAFGSTADLSEENIKIAVVVPDSEFFDADQFVEKLSAQGKNLTLSFFESEKSLRKGLKGKNYLVGILVEPPPDKRARPQVKIIHDNTSLFGSRVIGSYVASNVKLLSLEESAAILDGIWRNLDSISASFTSSVEQIDELTALLDSTEKQMSELEKELTEIDVSGFDERVENLDAHIEQLQGNIDLASSEVDTAKAKLLSYGGAVQRQRQKIVEYKNKLIRNMQKVQGLKAISSGPVAAELSGIESEMNDTIQSLHNTSIQLELVEQEITESGQKMDAFKLEVIEADRAANQAKSEILQFTESVSLLKGAVTGMQETISRTKAQRQQLLGDLTIVKENVLSLLNQFEKLREYNPATIANPFIIWEEPLYDLEYLSIIAPMVLALVLLLTCVLLSSVTAVSEKNQGGYLRFVLSPASKLHWLGGKILGQLVFSWFISIVILLLAVFGFGVCLSPMILDLFLALTLISFAFISMGLAVSAFTDSQSTAVLSSLLVVVPMLFLSGLIFPVDLMPEAVQFLSFFLPLTVAIEFLLSIAVRGEQIFSLLFPSLYLLVFGFALLFLSNIKR